VRIVVAALFAVALFATAAYGQIAGYGGGTRSVGPSFDKRWEDFGQGLGGGSGGSGSAPVACLAGQLDFSLTTGCNVTFYVLGVT
jgi:hypothetical protein